MHLASLQDIPCQGGPLQLLDAWPDLHVANLNMEDICAPVENVTSNQPLGLGMELRM